MNWTALLAWWFIGKCDCFTANSTDDLKTLDVILSNYDRRVSPKKFFGNESPLAVDVSLYILSLTSPNPKSMDFNTDFYIHQRWHDKRFQGQNLSFPLELTETELVKRIWKPEAFFPNGLEMKFHYLMVPNLLVIIYPDGEVLVRYRLSAIFSCMMDLTRFPLDKQVCSIEIARFSKTNRDYELRWDINLKTPVITAPLELSLFELNKVVLGGCNRMEPVMYRPSSQFNGGYNCIKAEFHLFRSIGYHLVQNYLPTTLMVIISWVSFWMDVNSVAGRISLGITTLLTVSSVSTNIQETLPQTSYIKALDVWLGACTAFVFLALLEFTFVNFLFRKSLTLSDVDDDCLLQPMTQVTAPEVEASKEYNLKGTTTAGDHDCCGDTFDDFQKKRCGSITSAATVLCQDDIQKFEALNLGSSPKGKKCMDYKEPEQWPLESEELARKCSRSRCCLHQRCIVHDKDEGRKARLIDERSRVAFPVAFVIFNCLYWSYFFWG